MLNFLKGKKKRKCEPAIPKTLAGFRDVHKGERCFIIGNGPSLKAEDLDRLEGEYTFGVNRIYLIFGETKWRPSYYAVQDRNLAEKYGSEIAALDLPVKFVAERDRGSVNGGKGHYYYYNYVRRLFDGSAPRFSEDIAAQTYEGGTVTYLCMQLAAYMGFKEICLLGNDFNYSVTKTADNIVVNNVKDYFSDQYITSSENRFFPRLDLCEAGFRHAREVLEEKGIRVYNATRGGKLEVFPRVDFEKLMDGQEGRI